MAPMTRRAQASAKKPPPRKARTRAQAGNDEVPEEDSDMEGEAQDIASRLVGFNTITQSHTSPMADTMSLLNPLPQTAERVGNSLQKMAEKVGNEVEAFAEILDRFLDSEPRNTNARFDAIIGVVEDFKAFAENAVAALIQSNRLERAQILRQEWSDKGLLSTASPMSSAPSLFAAGGRSSNGNSSTTHSTKVEQVEQWRQWQQEADLWELFRLILELHHDPNAKDARAAQRVELERQLDNYTSEEEIYERFLIHNDLARERAAIKRWLEQTASHQESDIEGIMQELEIKAKRGTGLWSSGSLYTRERIKGEKRLRTWPSADESPLPQVKRSDTPDLLVTTLDPDAISRQDRTLEKPDSYFEKAIWIACWEMLRRGKPWAEVSQWYDERREGWRAISIGKASDTGILRSDALWRKMCYFASQSGSGSSNFEAAVYGLLGGNLSAVNKVCRTVDDHFYAHYSVALTRQFDRYLAQHFPDRAAHSLHLPDEQFSFSDTKMEVYRLTTNMRASPLTSKEALLPMKMIQSFLLANNLLSLVQTLGCAIAYTDSLRSDDKGIIAHLRPYWTESHVKLEAEIALNPRSLRIATHMALLYRALESALVTEVDEEAEANIFVAYIQSLRAAGKRDLIPLYASNLPRARNIKIMSQALLDITDPAEQETTLKLLAQNQSDCLAILQEQLSSLIASEIDVKQTLAMPFKMLETVADTKLYPGQRIIAKFLPDQRTQNDESIIRSLRWFNMLPGHWNETFKAFSLALRRCLISGRIASAVEILKEFPYDEISIRKSYQVIGKSINMAEHDGRAPAEEAALWNNMRQQSRTYFELEALVSAIRALALWRDEEVNYTTKKPKLSAAPIEVKHAKELVMDAMVPVLNGILNDPADDNEAADLAMIRVTYIPEVILAYNTVLHSAGSLITRDALIESMDLSVIIAGGRGEVKQNHIAQCFVQAKRMRELVTSFTLTSKVMLLLKAEGKPWRPRKDREGKDLGMWEIGPQMLNVREAAIAEPDGLLKRQPFSRRSSSTRQIPTGELQR